MFADFGPHLKVLGVDSGLKHAIWTAETAPARHHRYQRLLTQAVLPGHQYDPSHKDKRLWRTLRAAELAGLDASAVITTAVGERSLTGARDLAAVIDDRIRHRADALIPLPAPLWSAQLPEGIADPERCHYAGQIAALMDARKQGIGEHAATTNLPWAVTALGPDDPATRPEWQQRAASIGAYREPSGHDHPADPIGSAPAANAPELRAAWHEALAALDPVDGPYVPGMPDSWIRPEHRRSASAV